MRKFFKPKYVILPFVVAIVCLALIFSYIPHKTFGDSVDTTLHPLGGIITPISELPKDKMAIPASSRQQLPSSIDLSNIAPLPGNQGRQGSCMAWAVNYSYKSFCEEKNYGWDLSQDSHLFSPAYVYNQIVHGADFGSTALENMQIIIDQGIAPLSVMPYSDKDTATQPTNEQREIASQYKALGWRWFPSTNTDAMRSRLATKEAVVIGIPVYPDFDNINVNNPVYDNHSGTSRGGHGICIIGYDDNIQCSDGTKGAYKFINSWGRNWGLDGGNGVRGYGYISYSMIQWLNEAAYYLIYEAPSITLQQTSRITTVGDKFTLSPTLKPSTLIDKSVTWVSSNSDVASVDENGLVTTHAIGPAIISATSKATGKKATCVVTVNPSNSLDSWVNTGSAANIADSSVKISGSGHTGIKDIVNCGIYFSTDPALDNKQLVNSPSNTSPFVCDITGLKADTTYYYQAYVNTSTMQYQGAIKSFKTTFGLPSSNEPQPKVTTGNVTSNTNYSLKIDDNTYSNFSNISITNVGIYISTDPNLNDKEIKQRYTTTSPFTIQYQYNRLNTTYYYQAFVDSSAGTFVGEVKSFNTSDTVPNDSVTTGKDDSITSTGANIVNNTYTSKNSVNNCGVQYSTDPNLADANSKLASSNESPFSVELSNLTPETVYYYQSYINTANGKIVGEIKSFKTLPNAVDGVTTGKEDSVTSFEAKIIDNIYTSKNSINNCGVFYSTDPVPTNVKWQLAASNGSPFSVALNNLKPDTVYYYQGYINTPTGQIRGEIKSFKTLPGTIPEEPKVLTGNTDNITSNSVTIKNNTFSNLKGTINNCGVHFSTDPNLNPKDWRYAPNNNSPFETSLTGLLPNTTYYYQAYVNTTTGQVVGETKSFRTSQ